MAETSSTSRPAPGCLRTEDEGAVRWIVIDNPTRMNAFTADMWRALPRLIRAAEADAAVRVVVLRGEGERAFSAGADISEFETNRAGAQVREYDELNHEAFEVLAASAKPTIAMIRGFCMGGALEVAACCDLRIAAEGSQFAIPAAKLGIGYNPRWVKPLLGVVSAAAAKELLYTGRRFDHDEARAMGLLNRVVPAERLRAAVMETAAAIAENAPLSVLAAKRSIDELVAKPENADFAALDALVEACFMSEDYAEGRRAFLEKRKPKFSGR
ncbi:MAG: enoyl-CoA hydratase [Hyphomicrobiaceae bacterium]